MKLVGTCLIFDNRILEYMLGFVIVSMNGHHVDDPIVESDSLNNDMIVDWNEGHQGSDDH